MIGWKNERTCLLQKGDKQVEVNVNRLTKQYPWDDHHLDTSGTLGVQQLPKSPQQALGVQDLPAPEAKEPPLIAKDGEPQSDRSSFSALLSARVTGHHSVWD